MPSLLHFSLILTSLSLFYACSAHVILPLLSLPDFVPNFLSQTSFFSSEIFALLYFYLFIFLLNLLALQIKLWPRLEVVEQIA